MKLFTPDTPEEWVDIEETVGRYQISSLGRIMSIPDPMVMYCRKEPQLVKPLWDSSTKMYKYRFCVSGKRWTKTIHRIVAFYFVANPLNLPEVNHKNGNRKVNAAWNLEWTDGSGNVKHAYNTGLMKRGTDFYNAKLVLHTEIGFFSTLTEAALISGYDKSHMAKILNGDYPNKTKFVLV